VDSRQGHSDYAEGEVCRGGEEAKPRSRGRCGSGCGRVLTLCKDRGLMRAACYPCAQLRKQSLEEACALLHGLFSVSLAGALGGHV